MRSLNGGLYFVFAASCFGVLGCSATGYEETVAQEQSALDISGWNGLVAMGSTGSYRLTADINASGKTWTPKSFSGTFDGGNHTISNLTVSNGGFFLFLNSATVKNVRFINLRVTGSSLGTLGGLAASADDSTVENCAVEVNINVSAIAVGGMFGMMTGGRIYRSYVKGSVNGSADYAGGFVGYLSESSLGVATIEESYVQAPVTTVGGTTGGLAGYAYASDIHDAYAVGNVTGRGAVGGIVGALDCTVDSNVYYLYKTIYRGDVVDKNWSANNGWSGAVGTFKDCTGRFEQNFYDRSLDQSAHRANHHSIQGYTTTELRSPTSVIGGVFCAPDIIPERCGDNTWQDPPWNARSNMQHHALRSMPGPNLQAN